MGPELLHADARADLRAVLARGGVEVDRPVLVCVGGAAGMTQDVETATTALLRAHLVPALDEWGAVVVDGGTNAGLMRALGRARSDARARFPLVGVAAEGTVTHGGLPRARAEHSAELDPHHTHAVLVPGEAWGDESPWVSRVAAAIAGPAPSATLLVNGGRVSLADVRQSIAAGRPVVVLAGSGGVADEIAAERDGARPGPLAADPLTHIASFTDGESLVRALGALLAGPGVR
jgi:hypothetical protein